jgi:hypothetical protein
MPIDITANYIRIRVASPKDFIRFRVKEIGKGIKAVVGFKKGGGSEIQSFLFPKANWNLAKAKAWIKGHNYTVHESWLVTDIICTADFIEFQETLITPDIEKEIDAEWINKTVIEGKKPEKWEWLFDE